jgi:hypothetical protein
LQDEKDKLQDKNDMLQNENQELKKIIRLNNYNGSASSSLENDVNNGVNFKNTDASGYTNTSLGNHVNN